MLHLPSSGLHILSYKSGASHGVLYMPTGVLNMPSCTSEASQQTCRYRSGTSRYWSGASGYRSGTGFLQHVYWVHLAFTAFAIKCTAEAIIRNKTRVLFRSLIWVYCICHQVYCRGHHLTLGTTLRCTLGASLRCATFAIKWSAYPIM